MLDRVTALARGLARQLHFMLKDEASERSSWRFRFLSWLWRQGRAFFHRLCRRQPPLLLVLDGPAVLSGFASLSGWCLGRTSHVVRVEAWVNGACVASTTPDADRSDVRTRFPHFRWKGLCGFRLTPPPGFLPDGEYPLVLRAEDARGRRVELRTQLVIQDYRLADSDRVPAHLQGSNREYRVWLEQHAWRPRPGTPGRGGHYQPLISIVMPIFRPNVEQLREAIASVRCQSYQRWELCLSDDGSQQAELTGLLAQLATEDDRVRLLTHTANRGISAATNDAISTSRGEYVAFMDQDDLLAPNALQEVAQAAKRQTFDLLYSDEDRIDEYGCRVEPFFKPDWSPDLLHGMMYLAHLCVYRREFLDRIGWCDSAFDGGQDWELALRATAQTERIVHLPQILYHWRLGGNSASSAFNRICHERGRRAIAEAMKRSGRNITVADGPSPCTFHVRYQWERQPLVSILIPTRDNPQLLRNCLRSLRRTTYASYEIFVIDNGSRRPEMLRYLRRCGADRVLRYDIPFNHSLLNNLAAKEARGELLLLLNDDTEVMNPDWLPAMVEQALRPEVGAVGAWLFHPDGRTQHNGIVLGIGPVASPLHSGITRDGLDRGMCRLIRNVSAVTGACLMIRKQLYEEIGGLDAQHLPTSFNDVDLCLRLGQAGYRILQTPLARLRHHESATRHIGTEAETIRIMWDRWGEQLARDPYWNPNLAHGTTLPPGLSFHWGSEAELAWLDKLEKAA